MFCMARDTHSKSLLDKENTRKSSLLDAQFLENYVTNSLPIRNIYDPITYLHPSVEKENLTAMSNVKRNALFPDNKGLCLSDMENDALLLNVNSASASGLVSAVIVKDSCVNDGKEINLQHTLKFSSTDESGHVTENKISAPVAKPSLHCPEKNYRNVLNDKTKNLPSDLSEKVMFDSYAIHNGPLMQDKSNPFTKLCSSQEFSKIKKTGDGRTVFSTSSKSAIYDNEQLHGTNRFSCSMKNVLNDNRASECNGNAEIFSATGNCVLIKNQTENLSEVAINAFEKIPETVLKSERSCLLVDNKNTSDKVVRVKKNISLTHQFAKKKLKIYSSSLSSYITKAKNVKKRNIFKTPFKHRLKSEHHSVRRKLIFKHKSTRERIMPQLIPLSVPCDLDDTKESIEDEVICVPDSPEMPTLIPFTSENEEPPQIHLKDNMDQMLPVETYVSPELIHKSGWREEIKSVSKDLSCIFKAQDELKYSNKSSPDIPDTFYTGNVEMGLQPKVVLRRICLKNYKPYIDKSYANDDEDKKLPELSSPVQDSKNELTEFLQETTDPEIDVIDGQSFYSFHSKQHMEQYSDNHGLSLPFPSERKDFEDEDDEEIQPGMIIPTKTHDITQIKGWRNKFFAPEIHIPNITNELENSMTSVDSVYSDESIVENLLEKYHKNHPILLPVTKVKKELSPEEKEKVKTEEKDKVKTEEKGKGKNDESVFVSDALEYFLDNQSKLQVSLLEKINPNVCAIPENASILSLGSLRKLDDSIKLKRAKLFSNVSSVSLKFSSVHNNYLSSNDDMDDCMIDDLREEPFSDDDQIPRSELCKGTYLGNGKLCKRNKQKSSDLESPNSHRLVLRLKKQVSGNKDDYRVADVSNTLEVGGDIDRTYKHEVESETVQQTVKTELETDGNSLMLVRQTTFSLKNDGKMLNNFLRDLNRCGEMNDLDAMLIKHNQTYLNCPLISENRAMKAVAALPRSRKEKYFKKANLKSPFDKGTSVVKTKQKDESVRCPVEKSCVQKIDSKGGNISPKVHHTEAFESRGKRCRRMPARYLDSAVIVAGSEWVSPITDSIMDDMNKKSKRRKIENSILQERPELLLYSNKNPMLFPNATWSTSNSVLKTEMDDESLISGQDVCDENSLGLCARTKIYVPKRKWLRKGQQTCLESADDCVKTFISPPEASGTNLQLSSKSVECITLSENDFDVSNVKASSSCTSKQSKPTDCDSSFAHVNGIPSSSEDLMLTQNHDVCLDYSEFSESSLLVPNKSENLMFTKQHSINHFSINKESGGTVSVNKDDESPNKICHKNRNLVMGNVKIADTLSSKTNNEFLLTKHLSAIENDRDLKTLNHSASEKNKVSYIVLKSLKKVPEDHDPAQDMLYASSLRKISLASSPSEDLTEKSLASSTCQPEGVCRKRKVPILIKPMSVDSVSINGALLNETKSCSTLQFVERSPLKISGAKNGANFSECKSSDISVSKSKSPLMYTISPEKGIQAPKQASNVQPISIKQIASLNKSGFQLSAVKIGDKYLLSSSFPKDNDGQKVKISSEKQGFSQGNSKVPPNDSHFSKNHPLGFNRSTGPTLVSLSTIQKSEVNMSKESIEANSLSLNEQQSASCLKTQTIALPSVSVPKGSGNASECTTAELLERNEETQELLKLSRSAKLLEDKICSSESNKKDLVPLSMPKEKVILDKSPVVLEEHLVDIETVEEEFNELRALRKSMLDHDQNVSGDISCSSKSIDSSIDNDNSDAGYDSPENNHNPVHILRRTGNQFNQDFCRNEECDPASPEPSNQNQTFFCSYLDIDSSSTDDSDVPTDSINSSAKTEGRRRIKQAVKFLHLSAPELKNCDSFSSLVRETRRLIDKKQLEAVFLKYNIMKLLRKRETLSLHYRKLALELPPKERKKNAQDMITKIRSSISADPSTFPRPFDESCVTSRIATLKNLRLRKTFQRGIYSQIGSFTGKQLNEVKKSPPVIDITDSDGDDADISDSKCVSDNTEEAHCNKTENLNSTNGSVLKNENILLSLNTPDKIAEEYPGIVCLQNNPQVKEYLKRNKPHMSIRPLVHPTSSRQNVSSLCQEEAFKSLDSDEGKKSLSETGEARLKHKDSLLNNNSHTSQDFRNCIKDLKSECLNSSRGQVNKTLQSQQYSVVSKNVDFIAGSFKHNVNNEEASSSKADISPSASCVFRTINLNDGRAVSYMQKSKCDSSTPKTATIRKIFLSPPVTSMHVSSQHSSPDNLITTVSASVASNSPDGIKKTYSTSDSYQADKYVNCSQPTMQKEFGYECTNMDSDGETVTHCESVLNKELNYECAVVESDSVRKTVTQCGPSSCDNNADVWVTADTGEPCIITRIDSDSEGMDSCEDDLHGTEPIMPTIVSCSTISEETFYKD